MKQFTRALRIALRHPATVAGCWITSLLVAVLWATNLVAVWPIVDAVMLDHSVPEWLAADAADLETQLAALRDERIRLEADLEEAPADEAPALEQRIADARLRTRYAEEKLGGIRWVQPIAERWLPDTPFETLGYVCAFVLAGTLVKNLFRIMNLVLVARIGQLVTLDLRRAFFGRILRLDLQAFSDRGRGDLMNRCTSDIQHVGVGVFVLFGQALREPLKMLACRGDERDRERGEHERPRVREDDHPLLPPLDGVPLAGTPSEEPPEEPPEAGASPGAGALPDAGAPVDPAPSFVAAVLRSCNRLK